jgi:DNA-binding NarL/FixJ family response regulator
MIVLFMPAYRQKVATAWNKAASSFPTEKDQEAYYDDILNRVQEMEYNIPPQLSNFEEQVAALAIRGLSNSNIQEALSASPREVGNTITRLTRKGVIEPRPAGRPPHERRA